MTTRDGRPAFFSAAAASDTWVANSSAPVAAAKHDVAIRIARGPYDGHSAGPVDAQETVWSRRRDERVHAPPRHLIINMY